MLGCVIVIVGAVVSTVIFALAAVLSFLFPAPSDTFPHVTVNVTAPFLLLNHLYTTVNVLLAAVHHAVTLTISKFAALLIISHVAKLVVLTPAHPSVHVNTICHVAFAATCVLLGAHHVQLGFVLSIFVTHVLQLHTFHAKSFTYHVCTPFAVTLNVFVLP